MVNWTNIYFAGKIIFGSLGIISQLVIIFIIWKNGGFKK